MERKLLSLPSFFVLLLVAGIAFLAAPVVELHAAAPTVNVARTTPATGTASSGNLVFTITFSEAVKVTGEMLGGSAVTAAMGFGIEDIEVKFAPASTPAGRTETSLRDPVASEFAKTDATPTAGIGTTFTVTLAVPSNENGTATVAIRMAGTGDDESAFNSNDGTNSGAGTPYADGVTSSGARTRDIPYANYDGTKPTVGIALDSPAGSRSLEPFLVTFTFTDAGGFATAGPTFVKDSINVTGGSATELGSLTGTSSPYTVKAYIQANSGVSEVLIGVAANAVRDAANNGNDAIPHVRRATDTPPATHPMTLRVVVDTIKPFVDIGTVTTPASPTAESPVTSIAVTFTVKEESATGAATKTEDLDAAAAARAIAANEVTVEGGTISAPVAKTGTFDAVFTATVTPGATATEVTIGVNAGAVVDIAGNGNDANTTPAIATGYVAPTTGPTVIRTGVGTALTSPKNGFSFNVGSINANEFVVLARSPGEAQAGFTSAAGDFGISYGQDATPPTTTDTLANPNRIDIKDDIWVDLRHFFVGREGGSVDLIGPTGTKVRDLVISEVMWGNDNGLSTPADGQWIELYNTTGATIPAGTWSLEFSNKSKGADISANGTALTSPGVVDKLSTWRSVGSAWAWRIGDTAGGSHGQSGKSTPNSATSPGSPVELISMQRKIDYNKVEKTHDATDTAKNRTEQLKDFPNGAAAGGWEATKEHGNMRPYRKGTPGAKPVVVTFDKTPVPRGSVVFNEIANRSDKKHDWIELHNKSSSDQKINGWELSVVQVKEGKNTDTELFTFTAGSNGDDIVVPAKGYLLIVNTDPRNTPLEGGYDVVNPGNSARQSDGAGNKPSRLYYVSDKLDIPEKEFLLILRNGNDKTGTHEKIQDIAGNNPAFTDETINTEVWPLRSWTLGATNDLGQKNDKTWARDQGKAVFNGDEWKDNGGFTGVGIDRKYKESDNYTSGTPGYANGAVQNEVKSDGLTDSNPVVISEIMFAPGDGRVPQWIELHNPSDTQAVNLKNWKLEIHNYYGDETLEIEEDATLTLPEVRIQPNQTVLIVSTTGRNSGADEFPDDRLISVWSNTDLRTALKMQNRRDAILSSIGFYLKLSDPRKVEVDEAGNIDGRRNTNDEPAWALPGGDDDGVRNSMVRDLEGSANDGTVRDAWRDASMVASDAIKADELYYGDDEDVGTPGYTPGGVLPVQLSSFYSKRNDAGAVIITWSTESELDNAGFNILRSLSRVGEFTRINAQLIPGAGTTGEKNTYTWTDTSARPNVVYYYQIEDVSLDGEHRTLRTTRLRGYVGAAGKATTIWGELKSRD